MQSLIIIGAGLAGYTLAREFRKRDKTTAVTLITADDGGFYSKPMLSNALALEQSPAQLVTKTAAQMADQLDIRIMTRTEVTEIDTGGKKVRAAGSEFGFDKLVIAVGAQPIRLPLAGTAAPRVMSVNHVRDYAQFRARLEAHGVSAGTTVAILGAGLIGCEFANDLATAGYRVIMVDPGLLPLAALTPPAIASRLQTALNKLGVELHCGVTAQSIDDADGRIHLSLSDGSVCAADLVLSAVGLRADLTLAQGTPLETNRGIIVDEQGRTSHPDIYALGDCAEYRSRDGTSRVLPYVAPIMNAARAIAGTLDGDATSIDLSPVPVLIKTPVYPIAVVPPPVAAKEKGNWIEEQNEQQTICRFYDENRVMVGFGVAPHDMAIRRKLMTELGSVLPA